MDGEKGAREVESLASSVKDALREFQRARSEDLQEDKVFRSLKDSLELLLKNMPSLNATAASAVAQQATLPTALINKENLHYTLLKSIDKQFWPVLEAFFTPGKQRITTQHITHHVLSCSRLVLSESQATAPC